MPVFFTQELETVATFWRVFRKDGVALGFTSHDRDLVFHGLTHRAAPGMVPSAIRLTRDLQPDSAEVEGALSHDAISAADLANGLFDEARVEIGAVDWVSKEFETFYIGKLGHVSEDRTGFVAELASAKSELSKELTPRTSPTCRAIFCGRLCGLSAARFTHRATSDLVNAGANRVRVPGLNSADFIDGQLRFSSGPQAGTVFGIVDVGAGGFLLDRGLAPETPSQLPVELVEGCDHTLATCRTRFSNAVNFRGEPFLPGNDLLARYPKPQ